MAALRGFEKVTEVGGRRHVVKVVDGGAGLRKGKGGGVLLRIKIAAEVDGVRGEYSITFRRRGRAAVGYAYARASAPGGREADAERLAAVVKALTDEEPKVYRLRDGRIMIACSNLRGFARYRELAKYIVAWVAFA
jgi:hypothetical protein